MSANSIIRLNKFLAHSGVCSRRKADDLIRNGQVKVNTSIIKDPAYEVKEKDKIFYKGKQLHREKPVYILLNKPKDYISTTDDERNRKTVVDLVMPKLKKLNDGREYRIYPVGRLDRNTTGLIVLTNDGELAQKLAHPSFNISKTYKVELNRALKDEQLEEIKNGVILEDGKLIVDDVAYAEPPSHKIIGISIHSGKNRIIRRLFEHFGYKVVKLDRVVYAGLNKKNIPRGKWRYLSPREVGSLKKLS